MVLSWNEIKDRALRFSKEWADASREEADAKLFMHEFFHVFGISSKRVSTFEYRVEKLDETGGYIDLLWKGMMLIEMKSRGKSLDKAHEQALEYTHGLKEHELPRFILVCDFENFRLYDLEEDKQVEFQLPDLVNQVQHFGPLIGYQKRVYKEQDPVNIKAAELMGRLHDRLQEIGYVDHPLEVYLVRILFCLFADDTTIFTKNQFQEYIEQRTHKDGSDLAAKLHELFQILNTPVSRRFKNLDEQLADFPYINGKLFEENLPLASFDSKMRDALLDCCYIDWSKISPAIFGSMFQSVMNPVERRNLGAHYTSEGNILKLIKPLFLDELWEEFEKIRKSNSGAAQVRRLNDFHKKLASLTFLDPACGCGNFLVITYRELRLLELEVLRALNHTGQQFLDVSDLLLLHVDQFYGIEYEEFPARIAEVAMWLIDHQMNMLVSSEFGQYFVRLPLVKSATIIHGNALTTEWSSLLDPQMIELTAENTRVTLSEPAVDYSTTVKIKTENLTIIDERKEQSISIRSDKHFSYIIGNPPFVGKHLQSIVQKSEMHSVFAGIKGAGSLDYVAAWYLKAAQLIVNTNTKVAFVSTNSIVQGEQVGILWNLLFTQFKVKIHFAHRTFRWSNEAKGNAAVHVVIIGFAAYDSINKQIFEYEDINAEPHKISVKNINPYLVEGDDFALITRRKPISDVPSILFGSKLVDGGHYLYTKEEKDLFVLQEPGAAEFFREILSGDELLHGKKRYCLWLKDVSPAKIRQLKLVQDRVMKVKQFRLASSKKQTQQAAETPTLFAELRQPESDFILVPLTTSENRNYIPMGLFSKDFIVTNSCSLVAGADLYHFGVMSSVMHMTWMKFTSGRLKSDYRYSNTIVYNNYPWPENPTEQQVEKIESAAQKVLDVRAMFPESTLADLYDPLTMPPALLKAHNELDKAVDLAYRSQAFGSEAKRMEFLFELYKRYSETEG